MVVTAQNAYHARKEVKNNMAQETIRPFANPAMEDADVLKKYYHEALVELANRIDLYAFNELPDHFKYLKEKHNVDPDENLPIYDTPHDISNIIRDIIGIEWEEKQVPGGLHIKDGKILVELSS